MNRLELIAGFKSVHKGGNMISPFHVEYYFNCEKNIICELSEGVWFKDHIFGVTVVRYDGERFQRDLQGNKNFWDSDQAMNYIKNIIE